MRSTSESSPVFSSFPGTGETASAIPAARRRSCGGILIRRAEPEERKSSLCSAARTRSRQRTGTPAPRRVTLRSNETSVDSSTEQSIFSEEASPQSIASDDDMANLRRLPIHPGMSSSTNTPIASRSRSSSFVSGSPLSPPRVILNPKFMSSRTTAASPAESRRQ